MYPRRAKQKLTNVRWEAVFEGIQQAGWNQAEMSDVTGIPQKNISMMSTGRIDVPQESRGFIVICDDEDKTYFGGDGMDLNKALGLIERYKHKMLVDNAKAKGEE